MSTPVEDRYIHISKLDFRDKRDGNYSMPLALFKDSLLQWRMAAKGWAGKRVESYGIQKTNEKFPGKVIWDRKPVSSVEDFCSWYRSGDNTNEVRGIVHFFSFVVWSNQFFINLECEFYSIFGFQTTRTRCDGSVATHQGGSLAKIGRRCSGQIRERVQNTARREFQETVAIQKIPPSRRTVDKNNVPIMKEWIRANTAEHGFIGYLGRGEDHPDFGKDALAVRAPKTIKTPKTISLKTICLEGNTSVSDLSSLTGDPCIDVQMILQKHGVKLKQDVMDALVVATSQTEVKLEQGGLDELLVAATKPPTDGTDNSLFQEGPNKEPKTVVTNSTGLVSLDCMDC